MCHVNCGCSKGWCCGYSMVVKVLVIIGGINWGLVGVGMMMGSDWNVVHMLLGSMPTLEAVVYLLVGVSAVAKIFHCKCTKCMRNCACDVDGSMDGDNKMPENM